MADADGPPDADVAELAGRLFDMARSGDAETLGRTWMPVCPST